MAAMKFALPQPAPAAKYYVAAWSLIFLAVTMASSLNATKNGEETSSWHADIFNLPADGR